MAYQMLIDSAFQTTLEIFHKIFQKFFKIITHRVNWTVGCSDRTIRKANSKIFKNSQTAWPVQTGRIANSPKRPYRPKNWYCPNRLNSSDRANSPNSCLWFGLKFSKLRRFGAMFYIFRLSFSIRISANQI